MHKKIELGGEPIGRRDFLKNAALGAALLAGGSSRPVLGGSTENRLDKQPPEAGYKYRVAFGPCVNDTRLEPLPLQDWPAPQFDEKTIQGIDAAMRVQGEAGYNLTFAAGLFATYDQWPPDIISAADQDRRQKINRVIQGAKKNGLKVATFLGTYSWGYDKIMEADPSVRGKLPDGKPHPHAMCDANGKAFEYIKKIADLMLNNYEFDAVHLESCDQGCCFCPQCAGKDGVVGYNARINQKTADYIRSKWPNKTIYVITINWKPGATHFNDKEKDQIIELSKHVDCVFDQGHTGFMLDPKERKEFIKKMNCDYGTSGDLWLYHDHRRDRSSYFLPYVRRSVDSLKAQYEDGARGCLYYQGPANNAGAEAQMAVGGRVLSDTRKSAEEILGNVIETYYRPKDAKTAQILTDMFFRVEESYFGNWPRQVELFKKLYGFVPGEFKLNQALFGNSPGPSTFLKEPMLDAKGRKEYKKGLISALQDLAKVEGRCDDRGRLENIQRSALVTLCELNTVSSCLGDT